MEIRSVDVFNFAFLASRFNSLALLEKWMLYNARAIPAAAATEPATIAVLLSLLLVT